MNDYVKNKYIELINKLEIEDNIVNPLKAFILTFDGTNEAEFNKFMLSMLRFMMQFDSHKVKSEAFDKLLQSRAEYDEKLEVLSAELENTMHPVDLPIPPLKDLKDKGYN